MPKSIPSDIYAYANLCWRMFFLNISLSLLYWTASISYLLVLGSISNARIMWNGLLIKQNPEHSKNQTLKRKRQVLNKPKKIRIICILCQLAKHLNGCSCDRRDRGLASKYEAEIQALNLLTETFSERTAFPGNLFPQLVIFTFTDYVVEHGNQFTVGHTKCHLQMSFSRKASLWLRHTFNFYL